MSQFPLVFYSIAWALDWYQTRRPWMAQ